MKLEDGIAQTEKWINDHWENIKKAPYNYKHKKMKKNHKNLNFLPQQYSQNNKYRINHNYLKEQFNDSENIISQIKKIVTKCDFTLGNEVDKFEKKFAKISNSKFAIGVGSGTDAIILKVY